MHLNICDENISRFMCNKNANDDLKSVMEAYFRLLQESQTPIQQPKLHILFSFSFKTLKKQNCSCTELDIIISDRIDENRGSS